MSIGRKYRLVWHLPVLLCCFLVPLASVAAQQGADPGVTVVYEDEGTVVAPPEIPQALRSRVSTALQEAGFEVTEASTEPEASTEGSDEAEASGLLLLVGYELFGNELRLRFRLYDTQEAVALGGSVARGRVGLSLYNAVDDAINRIRPELQRYLDEPYTFTSPIDEVESITFRSRDEGAVVFFGGGRVGRIYDGTLRLPYTPFAVGSQVRVDIAKEGHHGIGYEVALNERDNVVQLRRLPRRHRYGAQVLWTTGQAQGLGVGFRYYAVPDYTFVQVERSFYMQGDVNAGGSVYHNDLALSLSQYVFFPHESLVRITLGAGFGVVLTDFADSTLPEYADFYLTVLSFGLELNLNSWAVFFRPQLRYAPGVGNDNLLGRSWIETEAYGPPLSLGVLRKW